MRAIPLPWTSVEAFDLCTILRRRAIQSDLRSDELYRQSHRDVAGRRDLEAAEDAIRYCTKHESIAQGSEWPLFLRTDLLSLHHCSMRSLTAIQESMNERAADTR
jgi:hypothetical protein